MTMQYIITFLLVTGTTFQIVQSDVQFQNIGVWIYPGLKERIMWLKDIAVDTTSDIMNYDNIMNLPSNMKDKIISVFTHKPSVPNTEMVDGQVSKVKIIKTVTTDNGEVPTDSKTVITTEEIETEMSQP